VDDALWMRNLDMGFQFFRTAVQIQPSSKKRGGPLPAVQLQTGHLAFVVHLDPFCGSKLHTNAGSVDYQLICVLFLHILKI